MIVLGIDPGPETHGAVLYDSRARRVLWADKAATSADVVNWFHTHEAVHECCEWERMLGSLHNIGHDAARMGWDRPFTVVIERPAAMGAIGVGIVGHMLDTAWVAGGLSQLACGADCPTYTMTRREVLRNLGVLSGKGSADSRVRAACIADHETPGGPPAVGRKAAPGPLYGVTSHAWQALGLVLAWLEMNKQTEKK